MMKKILILLFLLISSLLQATTYYVSTSGSDSNNGLSSTTPWQTLQYAEAHATAAGDIIALKKGDVWASTTALAVKHSGASGSPIIWDGSLWGSGSNASIKSSANRSSGNDAVVNIIACSYVTFKNIIVDGNNTQTYGLVIGGHPGFSNNAQNNENHITIDGCSVLNCGNGGDYRLGFLCQTWGTNISDITIQNCILDGSDDEQLSFYPGKSQDGGTPMECKNITIRNNTLTNWGRRGQSTGYGMQINNKCTTVLIENNTLNQGPNGKGDALHIESNELVTNYIPTGVTVRYNKITISRPNEWCVIIQQGQGKTVDMYSNQFISTSASSTSGGNIWIIVSSPNYTGAHLNFYNNTFYTRSGISYQDDSSTPGVCNFKNNIIYNAGTGSDYCFITNVAGSTVHSNNVYYRAGTGDVLLLRDGGSYKYQSTVAAWETSAKKDDPLFKNLSGFDFTLQPGSCAIGAGVIIATVSTDIMSKGFATPPSIGCYEASTSSNTPVVPVYVSSVIQNATPNILEITYNSSLASFIPAASAFSVTVNTASRSVISVAVSGTKVSLTLSSPVVNGNSITISYTRPPANPLQTASGGQAASLIAQPVNNNVSAAPAPPVYVSSVVQNATPNILEITYNLSLAPVIPATSSFGVLVNSNAKVVSSVAISGTRVSLTLASPVVNGDFVTVSYIKPATNPLQSTSGAQAASSGVKTVTNNVNIPNSPPVVAVNNNVNNYSGFVGEIDASKSSDNDKDVLIYEWSAPADVEISSVTSPDIKFLAPIVTETKTIDFILKVSDGKSIQSKTVSIEIDPYKPQLETSKIKKIVASDFTGSNNPENIIDNNTGTLWSSVGIDQWLSFELDKPFKISYFDLSFQKGQKKTSYFDIYASKDGIYWEPVFIKAGSCNFAGGYQIFDMPEAKTSTEYSFIKLVGQGTSQDLLNNFSEFKIHGIPMTASAQMSIYPNPAHDKINVTIDSPNSTGSTTENFSSQFIRIFNTAGKLVLEKLLDRGIQNIQIPIDLNSGVYIVQMVMDGLLVSVNKLIVY